MMEATSLSMQASLNKTPFQVQTQKIASAIRLGNMYADVILMTKEAGKSDSVKKIFNSDRLWAALKTTAMISSIPLLAGVGTGAVQQAFANKDERELKNTLQNSFRQAVDLDASSERPLLKDNMAKASDAFKTLVHFSPHVAADPSAARAFMSKIVGYDQGVDISSIKELTDIQRNIGQYGKKPGFSQGFAAGSKATGIDRVIGGSVSGAISPIQNDIGAAINPFNV
jgi:hypothetical protein